MRIGLYMVSAVAMLVCLPSCHGENNCDITDIQRLGTVSDEYDVVAYIRNCGATTDFTANVSIVEKREDNPNGSGNVFFAYGAQGVILEDLGSGKVRIIYAADRIIKQVNEKNGVEFVYKKDWRRF